MRIKYNSEYKTLATGSHTGCAQYLPIIIITPSSPPPPRPTSHQALLVLVPLVSPVPLRPDLMIWISPKSSTLLHLPMPHLGRLSKSLSQALWDPACLCSLSHPVPFCSLSSDHTQLPASLHLSEFIERLLQLSLLPPSPPLL